MSVPVYFSEEQTTSSLHVNTMFADTVRKQYNVEQHMTPVVYQQLEMVALQKADRLLRYSDENGADGMKLMQEKENYRIFQKYNERQQTLTMKGVITIHSSSADEIMAFLNAKRSAELKDLYTDLYGDQYAEHAVLFRTRTSSKEVGTPTQDLSIHWLGLNDVSPPPQQPIRDYVFMRFNRTFVTPGKNRASRGVSIWESMDLSNCKPIFKANQVKRFGFEECGFIVDASEDPGSTATRVTFVMSITNAKFPEQLQNDRTWLLRMAGCVRHLPSAIINRRIRRNQYIDKSRWNTRDNCAFCTSSFSVFKRQHHCRMCGICICSKCSTVRKDYNTPTNMIRICLFCLNGGDTSGLWAGVGKRPKSGSLNMTYNEQSFQNLSISSDSSHSRGSLTSNDTNSVKSFAGSSVAESLESFDSLLSSSITSGSLQNTSFTEDEEDVYQNTPFDYEITYKKGNPWPDAPIPSSEQNRLRRIQALNLSQTWANSNLKELLDLARTSANCPVSCVSVITASTSLIVTGVGLAGDQLPRDMALDSHTIMSKKPMVILDTLNDPRFNKNPLVSQLKIRFYIGIPLITVDGIVVGSLSLGDVEPRTCVNSADMSSLKRLASRMMDKMDTSEMKKHSNASHAPRTSPPVGKLNLY